MDLHHPILREFPQYRETIKRLKAGSDQFRRFFEEYHTLDEAIYRIEEEIEFATDQETEELKNAAPGRKRSDSRGNTGAATSG